MEKAGRSQTGEKCFAIKAERIYVSGAECRGRHLIA